MRLGDLELYILIAGRWKADGGLMFGVVPKVLWEKLKPADGNNMIECACVGLIARVNGRVIVCETGIGTKLSEKRARQVSLREPEGLLHSLKKVGIRPDEVDAVITTHLHWDHAGGLTRLEGGCLELTFPEARHPTPRSQVIVLRSGELACAVTGDLVCQTPHLRVPWTMSADIEPLRVLEEKARLFDEAQKHRWLLLLSHEPDQPAGYLEEDGRWRPEPRLA